MQIVQHSLGKLYGKSIDMCTHINPRTTSRLFVVRSNFFLKPLSWRSHPYVSNKIGSMPNNNIFGFLAIILAAVNIFGGFLVTQRMLAMYKKKNKDTV